MRAVEYFVFALAVVTRVCWWTSVVTVGVARRLVPEHVPAALWTLMKKVVNEEKKQQQNQSPSKPVALPCRAPVVVFLPARQVVIVAVDSSRTNFYEPRSLHRRRPAPRRAVPYRAMRCLPVLSGRSARDEGPCKLTAEGNDVSPLVAFRDLFSFLALPALFHS